MITRFVSRCSTLAAHYYFTWLVWFVIGILPMSLLGVVAVLANAVRDFARNCAREYHYIREDALDELRCWSEFQWAIRSYRHSTWTQVRNAL